MIDNEKLVDELFLINESESNILYDLYQIFIGNISELILSYEKDIMNCLESTNDENLVKKIDKIKKIRNYYTDDITFPSSLSTIINNSITSNTISYEIDKKKHFE